jgi:basic membrane protein A and related proteins
MKHWRMKRWTATVAACFFAGCTALVTGETGKGLGEPCADDDECHGDGICGEGICTLPCDSDAVCPESTFCFGNTCQLPLKVGFIYVGVPEDFGWTLTHEEGRVYVEETLPYVETSYVTNVFTVETTLAAIDEFVAQGMDVIVANSFSIREPTLDAAASNPDTMFLVCSGNETTPNLGTFFARSHQSWYVAGVAAATKSTTGRLGFVGSFVTPEVVRHINAFTLGARSVDKDVVVEVRWEGFWFDIDEPIAGKTRDVILAEELIETGCDVIAHNMDTPFVVARVEEIRDAGMDIFSIGNDNLNACDFGKSSCIGVAYWNWGPLYARMFDDIHKKRFDPSVEINDNIRVNPEESISYFGTNDGVVEPSLAIQLAELTGTLASDPDFAFRGPYGTTGQRGAVEAGEVLSEEELVTMCWFVDGVVEKVDPTDPMSADVDAKVPIGDVEIPPSSGLAPDCRLNQ